jgi:predicted ATPase/DNA-binding SARP family transcriptional activator
LQLRVLGPLDVVSDDGALLPLPAKERRLLAALAADRGQTRSVDALIDALWQDAPPRTAAKALQLYVSRLRSALQDGVRIRTDGCGYALELDEHVLDASQFERLLTEAGSVSREGNRLLAASLLARALALWRGNAFGELAYEDFARAEAERLEELRLLAFEEHSEVLLRLGRHEPVLAQLRELAVAHPLRERMQEQLMLALYRCGRQTEALDLYTAFRLRLRDQLGLEPGPQLRRLQQRILAHDPGLTAPADSEQRAVSLPSPPSSLLGRERELHELDDLLHRRQARLLVLTGAGGSGKTRLALEFAHRNAGSFANGVVFVQLAPLRDPRLVPAAILSALGLREQPGGPLETLATALRARELLLVLDNAEHLRAAAPSYAELLARLPRLSLLVTSRTVLHLSGEHVYPVEPLAEEAAIDLFAERARAANARFALTTENRPVIAQICAALDGLPLAIELAAARARVFSPQALLRRLDQPLRLLTGGARDLHERQRTVRATIDWSYQLLSKDEKTLFAYLAVFAGGCRLDAAEAVVGRDAGKGIDVVDGLASLVEQSLLQQRSDADGEPRFWMLETIHEYAAERLERRSEADTARDRHAQHFLALAEQAEPHLRGLNPRPWIDRLAPEQDNLRAALDRLHASGQTDAQLRLAGALAHFWNLHGAAAEGRQRLKAALDADTRPNLARANALIDAAYLEHAGGDPEVMKEHTEEALALSRQLGDAWCTARANFILGGLAFDVERDLPRAQRIFEECFERFQQLGDDYLALCALNTLAFVHELRGDRKRGRALREDALRRARAKHTERGEAATLGVLAKHAIDDGRIEDALAMLKQSTPIKRDEGMLVEEDLLLFAQAFAALNKPRLAAQLLSAATTLLAQKRDNRAPFCLAWLAEIEQNTVTSIREQLDQAAVRRAREEGQTLTRDQAIELALNSSD